MQKQVSIRGLMLCVVAIAIGFQCNLYTRVTFDSTLNWIEPTGDTWRNTKRTQGWPFEVFERSRQSLAHVIRKNDKGGNIWSMVYYSKKTRPIAILANFIVGVSLFAIFTFSLKIGYVSLNLYFTHRSTHLPNCRWFSFPFRFT
ncbi:hypothetical protein VN12_22670 [Pirellula sp. SH-Sr6A]|nr:hypothetical protein VN12_22670 [Pirellula sp. SH-Sr6A]